MEIEHREYRKVTDAKIKEHKMVVYHDSLADLVQQTEQQVEQQVEQHAENELGEFSSEEELLRDALERAAEQERDLGDIHGSRGSWVTKVLFIIAVVLVVIQLLRYGGNTVGTDIEVTKPTGKVTSTQFIGE